MFSYVDKKIREKLVREKKMVFLDKTGGILDPEGDKVSYISVLGPIPLPVLVNGNEVKFAWYPFVRKTELSRVLDCAKNIQNHGEEAFRELIQSNMSVNSALVYPDPDNKKNRTNPLIRLHSCCMTGDVFGSLRCECGPQLKYAFERIAAEKFGAVIYMSSHEGRGIGLWAKAVTYILQDEGQDTYQANISLGLPEDSRDFSDAAVIIKFLFGGNPIRLLTNNPYKVEQLEKAGQPVSESVNHVAGINKNNKKYLMSKKQKGHLLPEL